MRKRERKVRVFGVVASMDETLLDDIIRRLLATNNGRTVKQAQITEAEIRQLCLASKEVFLSQPNLLELEAPIKICGNVHEFDVFLCLLYLTFVFVLWVFDKFPFFYVRV